MNYMCFWGGGLFRGVCVFRCVLLFLCAWFWLSLLWGVNVGGMCGKVWGRFLVVFLGGIGNVLRGEWVGMCGEYGRNAGGGCVCQKKVVPLCDFLGSYKILGHNSVFLN